MGILADLTPFMGPMQAEQLAQFLRNISALKRTRSLRIKKQRRSSQSISFRSNLASLANWGSLANLEVISTFLGPAAVDAAFPLLEALTKAGQDHLAKAGQDGQEQPRKGENQAMEEQVPAQEKEA